MKSKKIHMAKYGMVGAIMILLAGFVSAGFTVQSFSCNSQSGTIVVESGGTLNCEATIKNTGNTAANISTVSLLTDGTWAEQTSYTGLGFDSTVSGGSTTTVSFGNIKPTTAGLHSFNYVRIGSITDNYPSSTTVNVVSIKNLILTAPDNASDGETFTISSSVTNGGNSDIILTIALGGCSLAPGETASKSLGTVSDNTVKSTSWQVVQGSGTCSFNVTASGTNGAIAVTKTKTDSVTAGIPMQTTTTTITTTTTTTTTTLFSVTLNRPLNTSVDYDGNIFLSYTPRSVSNISNCTLYTNSSGSFSKIETDTLITNGSANGFILLNQGNGTYIWNVMCYSRRTHKFADANRTYTVNKTTTDVTSEQVNTTANTPSNLSSMTGIANVSISITTNTNVSDAYVSISKFSNNTQDVSLSVPGLSKFISIEANAELENSISSIMLTMYYTDGEVAAAGINETDLAFYWFDTSANNWVQLRNTTSWVYGTGVNNVSNYVWANVSHFSDYTIAQGVAAETIEISMVMGWNLISLPLTL